MPQSTTISDIFLNVQNHRRVTRLRARIDREPRPEDTAQHTNSYLANWYPIWLICLVHPLALYRTFI